MGAYDPCGLQGISEELADIWTNLQREDRADEEAEEQLIIAAMARLLARLDKKYTDAALEHCMQTRKKPGGCLHCVLPDLSGRSSKKLSTGQGVHYARLGRRRRERE